MLLHLFCFFLNKVVVLNVAFVKVMTTACETAIGKRRKELLQEGESTAKEVNKSPTISLLAAGDLLKLTLPKKTNPTFLFLQFFCLLYTRSGHVT